MVCYNVLLQQITQEMFKMKFWRYVKIARYCKTPKFQKLFMDLIDEICKQNATKEVAPIIHQFLKVIFLESFTRVGVYKQIRYVLLPALWRDHMAIERQKVLDEAGRHLEAHVVRIIVKPYIRDLNLKWQNMTALDKVIVGEAEVQKYMFTYHSEGQFHFMFILYL